MSASLQVGSVSGKYYFFLCRNQCTVRQFPKFKTAAAARDAALAMAERLGWRVPATSRWEAPDITEGQALAFRKRISGEDLVRWVTAYALGERIGGRRIRMSALQVEAVAALLAKLVPERQRRRKVRK